MQAFARFQRDVYQRLLSCGTLSTVSIVLSRPRVKADGTIETATTIEQTLNGALTGLVVRGGKSGATIEVMLPNFEADGAGVEAVGTIVQQIAVRELPLLNMGADGTQLSAEEIAAFIIEDLTGWMVSDSRGGAKQVYPEKNLLSYFGDEANAAAVNMMVRLTRRDAISRRARAARVTIAVSAGMVTLTAGVGAAIRYTTNGEYPGSDADIPGVSTYAAPFAAPTSGETLRCVASEADKSASDLVERLF